MSFHDVKVPNPVLVQTLYILFGLN